MRRHKTTTATPLWRRRRPRRSQVTPRAVFWLVVGCASSDAARSDRLKASASEREAIGPGLRTNNTNNLRCSPSHLRHHAGAPGSESLGPHGARSGRARPIIQRPSPSDPVRVNEETVNKQATTSSTVRARRARLRQHGRDARVRRAQLQIRGRGMRALPEAQV